MKLVYATESCEDYTNSYFLAGPTPRDNTTESWRSKLISLIPDNFNGTLLIPEPRDGVFKADYLDQVEWEFENLSKASTIIFWVDRNLETLPGFTTNVEFGLWINSGRVLYGRPDGSPKTKYLDWLYEKVTGKQHLSSLIEFLPYLANISK